MPFRRKAGVKSKFNNVRTVANGIKFDSKAEADRYSDLLLLQAAKMIRELQPHPRYPLVVNGQQVCIYEADASYFDCKAGKYVVEDTKGQRTALFILKKKLLKACTGIEVFEFKFKVRRARK